MAEFPVAAALGSFRHSHLRYRQRDLSLSAADPGPGAARPASCSLAAQAVPGALARLAEHLTVWYGNEPKEMAVFGIKTRARYAPYFWGMVFLNFVVPFVLLGIRRLRSIRTAVISSVCVLVGMWLERYLIVVPTLANPR